MPLEPIRNDAALVLIDLQHGITALKTTPPAEDVLGNAVKLAAAFRERKLPVVLVHVQPAPGAPPVEMQPPPMTIDEHFAVLRPELGTPDVDIIKPGWDAFVGTGLDVQLRRRGVKTIVLGGIRTCIGVESTARTGFILGYSMLFAVDAMADTDAALQESSLNGIFPRLGRRSTTTEILGALGP